MSDQKKIGVLFVCMGNICRSPTAEGVFRHVVQEAGLDARFEIDSAGTHSYHVGDPPDERSTKTAQGRGVVLEGRARAFARSDLERFEYIVAMDDDNREAVFRQATPRTAGRIRMLREFDAEANGDLDVPDPYYGGSRGFEDVFDIIERSCRALLAHIRTEHTL